MNIKKLCKLKKKKIESGFDKLVPLVKPVSYICTKCGRASSEKKLLCKPRSVDKGKGDK